MYIRLFTLFAAIVAAACLEFTLHTHTHSHRHASSKRLILRAVIVTTYYVIVHKMPWILLLLLWLSFAKYGESERSLQCTSHSSYGIVDGLWWRWARAHARARAHNGEETPFAMSVMCASRVLGVNQMVKRVLAFPISFSLAASSLFFHLFFQHFNWDEVLVRHRMRWKTIISDERWVMMMSDVGENDVTRTENSAANYLHGILYCYGWYYCCKFWQGGSISLEEGLLSSSHRMPNDRFINIIYIFSFGNIFPIIIRLLVIWKQYFPHTAPLTSEMK